MFARLIRHAPSLLPSCRPTLPAQHRSLLLSYFSTSLRAQDSSDNPTNYWGHLDRLYTSVNIDTGEKSVSPEERWSTMSSTKTENSASLKGPYAGRSIEVKNGGVAEALNKLQFILSRNRVALELRLVVRHEKKGYKRRRLSSERWRKMFAHEVRKKVQLVNKIRARGA